MVEPLTGYKTNAGEMIMKNLVPIGILLSLLSAHGAWAWSDGKVHRDGYCHEHKLKGIKGKCLEDVTYLELQKYLMQVEAIAFEHRIAGCMNKECNDLWSYSVTQDDPK